MAGSLSVARCLTLFCLLAACVAPGARANGSHRHSRRDLDIGIGGGGGGSSGGGGISIGIGGGGSSGGGGGGGSGSSSEPRPCDFENERLYRAYLVIQKFRKTVTCDPQDITSSWSGTDLCKSYKGFFCERPPKITDRAIASVDFNGFNLQSSSLKEFVDALPDLALFHANSNNFGGFIPDLSRLPYFYELDVSNNKLASAPFPTDVLKLKNATFVDIRFNNFYGDLPGGVFCSFPQVQAIFVNNNQFSGTLPDNIGDSPVNYLSLANNKFTGEIPKSIARMANTLFEVLFLGNKLSGCLPYELGLLAKATVIDAGTNQLTGPIPASYACLRKVEQFNLADNLLYGEVPDALCKLAFSDTGRLRNLTLSNNYFTSLGSCCWDLIKQGKLNVDRNCIPWAPNQRSHEECAAFFKRTKTSACPCNTYVPCSQHKYDGAGSEGNTAAEEDKYRTYSALHP
uniref:Leucine-rich repeat-containing N-terminal plant-type domain-containing protein n=1 Tax=Leersia perrieri TaxID=77586 RepID=A0A0D9W6W0_9ORYZ